MMHMAPDNQARRSDGNGGRGRASGSSGGTARDQKAGAKNIGAKKSRGTSGGGGAAKGGSMRRSGAHAGHDGPPDRVSELAGPLGRVLDRLPATQRRVLEYRMGLVDGHPHSLSDTAAALGLDQTEARDIEARAFEHIREVIPLDRLGKLLDT